MASELSLTWDEHQSTLVGVFEKLLTAGALVDCTIAAEGQYLKAHKIILSACSPYFEMLFTEEKEKNPIVVLKDIKFQELKAMIDFIYRGKVKVPEERLGDFVDAAESLQIKGLGVSNKNINSPEQSANESSAVMRKKEGRVSPLPRKRSRRSYANNNGDNVRGISPVVDINIEGAEELRSQMDVPSSSQSDPSPPLVSARDSPSVLPSSECGDQRNVDTSDTLPFDESASEELPNPETVVVKSEPEPMAEVFIPEIECFIEPKSEEVVLQETMLDCGSGEIEPAAGDSQHSSSQYSAFSTALQGSSSSTGRSDNLLLMTDVVDSFNTQGSMEARETMRGRAQRAIMLEEEDVLFRSDEEGGVPGPSSLMKKSRGASANAKKQKRTGDQYCFKLLMETYAPDPRQSTKSCHGTPQSQSSPQHNENERDRQIQFLEERLRQAEEEARVYKEQATGSPSYQILSTLNQKFEEIESKFSEHRERLTEEVLNASEERIAALVEKKHTEVQDEIKRRGVPTTSESSTCGVLSDCADKVCLGEGIFCSKSAYESLKYITDSHTKWVSTLIRGVYGEDAPKMRLLSARTPGTIKFSVTFISIAKRLHRQWLEQQQVRMEDGSFVPKHTPHEIETYVDRLPVYMSQRCIAMNGPRGMKAKLQIARRLGSDAVQDLMRSAKPQAPKKQRKPYVKRGSALVYSGSSAGIKAPTSSAVPSSSFGAPADSFAAP